MYIQKYDNFICQKFICIKMNLEHLDHLKRINGFTFTELIGSRLRVIYPCYNVVIVCIQLTSVI